MIGDITTVMTKEWREFFVSGGSRRTGLVFLLIVLAIFGLYLPVPGRTRLDQFALDRRPLRLRPSGSADDQHYRRCHRRRT